MSEAYIRYHDEEWGVPAHDDRRQFEFLILEGAQAGLSWSTILNKREGYREAFADFDVEKVARFDKRKVERLMQFPGIVRNRLKIESAISNAKAVLEAAGRGRQSVKASVVVRRRQADREQMDGDEAGAGDQRGVRRAQQGPEEARVQVRGLDDHLRAHAGNGDGQRPHGRVLQAR